jgi:hypothetical protein
MLLVGISNMAQTELINNKLNALLSVFTLKHNTTTGTQHTIRGQYQATIQARVKVSAPPTLCRRTDPYFSNTTYIAQFFRAPRQESRPHSAAK